jgi:hypothetical protein
MLGRWQAGLKSAMLGQANALSISDKNAHFPRESEKNLLPFAPQFVYKKSLVRIPSAQFLAKQK